jgi:hypothetical protein
MGRARRGEVGRMIYHALNRANFPSRPERVPDPLLLLRKREGPNLELHAEQDIPSKGVAI